MTDSPPIAERTFELLKPNGERLSFTVKFGPVYRVDDSYRCPVQFIGWGNSPSDIWGQDSLQALLLALQLVYAILREFTERGGRVLYPGIDELYPLETLSFANKDQTGF